MAKVKFQVPATAASVVLGAARERARELGTDLAWGVVETLNRASRVERGVRVVVTHGRKVPLGTVGTVGWVGASTYGTRVRVDVDGGDGFFTAITNVEVIFDDADPAVVAEKIRRSADAWPRRGDLVRRHEDGLEGRVFWSGGTRIGFETRAGAVWANATEVALVERATRGAA